MQTQPQPPKTSAEYMDRLRDVEGRIFHAGGALEKARREGACEIIRAALREVLEDARAEKQALRCPLVRGVLPVCVGRGKGGKGRGFTVALDAITQGVTVPTSWSVLGNA